MRGLIQAALILLFFATLAGPGTAAEPFPLRPVNLHKFDRSLWPATVALDTSEAAGTLIVDTRSRHLYLVGQDGTAQRFGIAVGAAGRKWTGTAVVGRKARWPAWYPTDEMRHLAPGMPGRVAPGPANPLGARALYLYRDGRDTLFRIHGTSEPWTIGAEVSSGCIRMFNEDIIALYDQVPVGAKVIVR